MNAPQTSRLKSQVLDPAMLRLWTYVYGKAIA
jgi:hypothetical protein